MKKVLITGADSYIGVSVEKWMQQPKFYKMYQIDTLDVRNNKWKDKNFSGYDVVFHVAGIAHVKETKANAGLYYTVNFELAVKAAEKAKKEGVGQFVLLSSMNVYGLLTGVINKETEPAPKTNYGKSKLMADTRILKMADKTFHVAIVRPPMVYGKGCKGNYQRLSEFARKSCFFPDIKNARSMIYIENLAEFIRNLIEHRASGVFHPQNKEYVNTSLMVREIASFYNHRIYLIKYVGRLLLFFGGNTAKKVFGNLVYDFHEDRCNTVTFIESIKKTEGKSEVKED